MDLKKSLRCGVTAARLRLQYNRSGCCLPVLSDFYPMSLIGRWLRDMPGVVRSQPVRK